MNNMLECAGWLENSYDDGPGVRSVLFLQGCNKNCNGCHNVKIKEHGKGVMIAIDDLMNVIDSKCCNKKITISGGEPLEQMDNLIVLISRLKKNGYNVCVYTGWEFSCIPKSILNLVDYIKTGEFIKELIDPNIQYVGSKNQHMYKIKDGNIEELNLVL